MINYLSQYSPGELIALVSIVGGLVCGTVTIVAVYWSGSHKADIEAKLKADMLDRGMSAGEIEDVLATGSAAHPV